MRKCLPFFLWWLFWFFPAISGAEETRITAERIEADAAWSGSVVVTRPVTIAAGATLRVSPGAVVRFVRGAGLVVQGGLLAAGGPKEPIAFTSAETKPAPGDWAGIAFEGASAAELSRCTIRHAQVVTAARCRVVVKDCQLSEGTGGLVLTGGAAGEVVGNAVREMSEGGIRCQDGSQALVKENVVERCGPAGISSERDARVHIRENRVSGCGQAIAVLQNNALVESNTVEGAETGILILSGGKECEVRGNRVSKCGAGIVCSQFAMPLVEGNEVSGCDEGIVCYRGSGPWLKDNSVSGNKRGVSCLQISAPKVTGNLIFANKCGVYLHLSSYARINGNNFYDNEVHVELDNMSSDWEKRVGAKPQRGLQARNTNMAQQGKAAAQKTEDGAMLAGSVDARDNWWGPDTTAEMSKAGADANIKRIVDYFDVPTRTYEGYEGSFIQDRVEYGGWKKERIAGIGPRKEVRE